MARANRITKTARRITVVTGTRADYGIFLPVIEAIDAHPRLQQQLLVTGMHLVRRFGRTVQQIETDGWPIAARVRLQGERDDPLAQARALGRAITKMSTEFERLRSDIVLVLGDRLEMFAAAAAATAGQLVLAHIHGGDAAIGVQDDAYRHAISKLAHLHFAASAGARRRLKRLGEPSWRIYQTGSPALDNLSDLICHDCDELSRWAGLDVTEDFVVVAQHPAGASAVQEGRYMSQTLQACHSKGLKTLILHPNSDPGFSGIVTAAQRFCRTCSGRLLTSAPRPIYLGLLERSGILVGNSSSGIIEAGLLNVDVVNVGPRQTGRDRGSNVRDVVYGRVPIVEALDAVLNRRRRVRRKCRIYGDGRSGIRIASILARVKNDRRLRQKKIAY